MKNRKYILTSLATCFFLLLLNACSLKEPTSDNNRSAIDDALKESISNNRTLKTSKQKNVKNHGRYSSLQKSLMPSMQIPNTATKGNALQKQRGKRFDIAVNNVLAKDFFMGLVKDTKYNMTVNPKIGGTISLALKKVTIPQAMDAVRDAYGFEYEETSYGYKVFPRQLETRVFHVNYLDLDRSGQSQTTIGSGQITNTVQNNLTTSGENSSRSSTSIPSGVVNTSSNTKFWDLLTQNLKTLVGDKDDRSVVVDQKTGSVIVRAFPNEIRHVAKYIDKIEKVLHRQVIIEAKILEVELNAEFQNGINWKAMGLQQGLITEGALSGTLGVEALKNNTFIGNDSGNILGVLNMKATSGSAFSSLISLLNSQGNVNVLSSPRIATLNNQKAVIKVGTDRFFITDVSSDTTTGGTAANTSSDVTLTPFFSGISLDVTPQIDENNNITIHIHPIVSQVQEDKRKFKFNSDGNEQELPLAASTIRESDSIVRAKNGQVIVIGGLMASSGRVHKSSTPGVDKLPGIGGLFKSNKRSSNKFELVILLRPIIAETTATWQQQLNEAYSSVKSMKGDFSYNVVPEKKKH